MRRRLTGSSRFAWPSRGEVRARLAARAGSTVVERYFRDPSLVVSAKSPNDFVTIADRESERVIVETIRSRHPEDRILAGNLDGRHGAGTRRRRAARRGRRRLLRTRLVEWLCARKLQGLCLHCACEAEPAQRCAGSAAKGSRAAERRHGCFLLAQGSF